MRKRSHFQTHFETQSQEMKIFFVCLIFAASVVGNVSDSFVPSGCQPSAVNGQVYFVAPHPYDCQKFYMCQGNVGILMQCPGDLQFDTILNVCNYAHIVQCENMNDEPRIDIEMVETTTIIIEEPTETTVTDFETTFPDQETTETTMITESLEAVTTSIQMTTLDETTNHNVETTTKVENSAKGMYVLNSSKNVSNPHEFTFESLGCVSVKCSLNVKNVIENILYNQDKLEIEGQLDNLKSEKTMTFQSCDGNHPGQLIIQGKGIDRENNCLLLTCIASDMTNAWHNFKLEKSCDFPVLDIDPTKRSK